jgi:hypothetical protein
MLLYLVWFMHWAWNWDQNVPECCYSEISISIKNDRTQDVDVYKMNSEVKCSEQCFLLKVDTILSLI